MKKYIALTLSLSCLAATAHSADIVQSIDSTSDSSSNWNSAIWGDPAAVQVPGSSDTYISDGSITTYLRTGNYSNANFDNTLKLINGAQLINKSSNVNYVDIILEDNSSLSAGDNGNTFQETTTIFVDNGQSGTLHADSSGRTQTFESIISGSGTLNATGGDSSSSNIIDQSANTFSGLWTVSTSTLVGISDGSFGTGSFEIYSGGVLDIRYDFSSVISTSSLSIDTGGLYTLNSGVTSYFNSVTLSGSGLSEGTYTFSDLDAGQQSFFTDVDGTGSFVVVPEPSATGLLIGSLLLGFVCLRRR
jgi:hypothetical protein